MLSGNNGILQQSTIAKDNTEKAKIIETAQMDILGKQTENHGSLSADELEEILISPDYNTQGTLSNEENILERTLTSQDGKYIIPVSQIYSGMLSEDNSGISKDILDNLVIGATIVGYDPTKDKNGNTINTSYTSNGSYTSGTEGTYGDGTVGNGYSNQTFTIKSITNWEVLGKTDKTIIITPSEPILTDTNEGLYFQGKSGYATYIDELNKICALYGQGKYADTAKYNVTLTNDTTINSGARSINANDLANIGYTVTPESKTYTMNSTGTYMLKDDGTDSNGPYNIVDEFYYWDEHAGGSKTWKYLNASESVTLYNDAQNITETNNVSASAKEMILLNNISSNDGYYFATRAIANSDYANVRYDQWGMFYHGIYYVDAMTNYLKNCVDLGTR